MEAALIRLRAAGVSEAAVDLLSRVNFTLADLPGDLLGLATANGIVIDQNAAGNGWFIDPTPLLDEEFVAVIGGDESPALAAYTAGRMDLLSVVLHELAHKLGLRDIDATLHTDALMNAKLPAGTRRQLHSEELGKAFMDESLLDSLLLGQ